MPTRPPYSEIISDPNLNVNDKISVLEILDPENEKMMVKTPLDRISSEVGNTFIIRDISSNDRFPLNNFIQQMKNQQQQSRNLQKRSYLFYDDMSLHDTYDENETPLSGFLDSPYNHRAANENAYSCDDDNIAACASCGGKQKGKKKTDKGCKAKSCKCNDSKVSFVNDIMPLKTHRNKIRSVSDAW